MINSHLLIKYIFIVIEIIISQVLKKRLLLSFPLHSPDLIIYFYCWNSLHSQAVVSWHPGSIGLHSPSLPAHGHRMAPSTQLAEGRQGARPAIPCWVWLFTFVSLELSGQGLWPDTWGGEKATEEHWGVGACKSWSHVPDKPYVSPYTPKHLEVKIWGRPFPRHMPSSGCKCRHPRERTRVAAGAAFISHT